MVLDVSCHWSWVLPVIFPCSFAACDLETSLESHHQWACYKLSLGRGPLPWLPGSKDRLYLLRLLEWEAVLYADSCPDFSQHLFSPKGWWWWGWWWRWWFVTLTIDQLGLWGKYHLSGAICLEVKMIVNFVASCLSKWCCFAVVYPAQFSLYLEAFVICLVGGVWNSYFDRGADLDICLAFNSRLFCSWVVSNLIIMWLF